MANRTLNLIAFRRPSKISFANDSPTFATKRNRENTKRSKALEAVHATFLGSRRTETDQTETDQTPREVQVAVTVWRDEPNRTTATILIAVVVEIMRTRLAI